MSLYIYNSGVPNADNDPSVDQPDMLINAQSILGILGEDHVTFNNAVGGTHKQVRFSSSNVPSLPTLFPTLFVQTPVGGTKDELFFFSGSAAQSANQYDISTNGSVVLLGGIIIKWGSVGLSPNGTVVTFPVAFPNNCFNVQLTINDSTQKQAFLNVSAKTTANFTIRTINSNGTPTSTGFFYLAIGN